MLEEGSSYTDCLDGFEWDIPEFYNIGVDVCDKWAITDPDKPAIREVGVDGAVREVTFGQLRSLTNRLANALQDHGIEGLPETGLSETGLSEVGQAGDRIAVLLPQCLETAISHIAAFKLGCVSLPLFTLFGEEALSHRLGDSGARVVITNAEGAKKLAGLRDGLPDLELVLSIDGAGDDIEDFDAFIDGHDEDFSPVETRGDDPALLIYTSGTTGNPKGALHGHRVLPGHLPGVEMSHDFLPRQGDVIWTPADWAWIGGLLDVLMPALHHGVPVVACRMAKFSGEWALDFIRDQGIRNAFLPPTALKIMRQVPNPEDWGIRMRSVASGGEALGAELLEWGRKVLGVTINEFYGQTECNMVVSSCAHLGANKTGMMGLAVPGHRVDVVDARTGTILPTGEEGAIAVRCPDPVMFLGYWNRPEASEEKFVAGPDGKWLLMGDQGIRDADGFLQFVGRDDDVIGSAGYRIGPAEVEDCLIRHPAVEMAGVVGKPDPIRGAVVAAYITLAETYEASPELADEIALFVKQRLAAHEYPRVVRFVDAMPMTTTGKIIRARLRHLAQAEADAETA